MAKDDYDIPFADYVLRMVCGGLTPVDRLALEGALIAFGVPSQQLLGSYLHSIYSVYSSYEREKKVALMARAFGWVGFDTYLDGIHFYYVVGSGTMAKIAFMRAVGQFPADYLKNYVWCLSGLSVYC